MFTLTEPTHTEMAVIGLLADVEGPVKVEDVRRALSELENDGYLKVH